MATTKNYIKNAFPTEAMAKLLQEVLDRWKAKSPKAAKIATDALFWTGVVAMIGSSVPLPIPGWSFGLMAMAGAVLTKLIKE